MEVEDVIDSNEFKGGNNNIYDEFKCASPFISGSKKQNIIDNVMISECSN